MDRVLAVKAVGPCPLTGFTKIELPKQPSRDTVT